MSIEDELRIFQELCEMEEARSYLERGHALKDRIDEDLFEIWVATVQRWYPSRSDALERDMNDAAAEIRLRNLTIPTKRLRSLMQMISSEASTSAAPFRRK